LAELRVEGLTKRYGGHPAVEGVSFSVASGRFFALLGPSGSGKTTILRIISGFVQPDAGRVWVDGEDVTEHPPERRRMGVVFQSYALFPHMSVWENVAFGPRAVGLPLPEVRRRVEELLAITHLEGLAQRRPDQLSGGQQQRVALARALAVRPRLLLLDEPLSALDRRIRVEMRAELRRIQREAGVTAVIVTHDQEEAMELADELLVLEAGRVQQAGTPQVVYTHPASPAVAAFMGRSNAFPGRLRRGPEGTRELSGPAGLSWRIGPGQAPWADLPEGPVRVAVRPERLVVEVAGDGPAVLQGAVFEGPVTRLTVHLEGLELEALVLSREAEGLRPGDRLRLRVAAGDLLVYPEGAEASHAGREAPPSTAQRGRA
jgi:ABC-type Fe3+/spermidine/putrescine transport system ATPase subunit